MFLFIRSRRVAVDMIRRPLCVGLPQPVAIPPDLLRTQLTSHSSVKTAKRIAEYEKPPTPEELGSFIPEGGWADYYFRE